ncbi:MAG: hypothetical protein EXQ81_03180 [Thermoleophilia bacterium]|nr:hypothetical protein [Thermoleophilia bacterium]
MTALVEGFDADACGLARFLAGEGQAVRIAAPESETAEVSALRGLGISVEPDTDLDAEPGEAEVAYLDVWTPEVAPRVARLRAQGTRISCLGDLLLERWQGPTIGITGTAGKTTTTSLVASMLRADGRDIALSAGARAGNLWPTADLLDLLTRTGLSRQQVLLVELTSSHLAFMCHSPTVAAVVSFWPDHLELHGDLPRYHAAKATIVRHQSVNDVLVVNADDASVRFADDAPGRVVAFSLRDSPGEGAYLDHGSNVVLVEPSGAEVRLGPLAEGGTHRGNVVAAAAIARAAGVSAGAIAGLIGSTASLPYRARPVASLRGVPVVDDGMAATPMKSAALLAGYPDCSVVLIAGGRDDAGGGPVHATAEESALLDRACDEIARAARCVVLFGAGGARLGPLLEQREVDAVIVDDIAAAVRAAGDRAAGAAAIVFSPLHPLPLEERAGFEALVAGCDRLLPESS